MFANSDPGVIQSATKVGGASVIRMEQAALRRLGMIATSSSWRRFWQQIRLQRGVILFGNKRNGEKECA